jgi:hypothetical protein
MSIMNVRAATPYAVMIGIASCSLGELDHAQESAVRPQSPSRSWLHR